VALLTGCAQRALNTDINEATIRLLTRHGCEVVIAKGHGLLRRAHPSHGQDTESHASAAANIRAWMKVRKQWRAGCSGHQHLGLRHHGQGLWPHVRRRSAGRRCKDSRCAGEGHLRGDGGSRPDEPKVPKLKVAYHAACSLQHGQQIKTHPKTLLAKAGFTVLEPADPHLCCGSAGTYNMMQPEISKQLKDRKVKTLEALTPDVIAAGNIGCMMQIGGGTGVPVVHTAELLDWATGGPVPPALALAGIIRIAVCTAAVVPLA
jgi:glycolate oxidase iron-sulfur subunit